MARTNVFIDAPPTRVYEVLADAGSYGEWVVGSREIQGADESWPTPGSRFGHSVGVPPLLIRDQTVVLDAQPPVQLALEARARPLPSAHVTFALEPWDGGMRVTMTERLAHPLLNLLAGPVGHAALHLRNRETLRRLKSFAEHGQ